MLLSDCVSQCYRVLLSDCASLCVPQEKGRELGRSASQDLLAVTQTPDWDKQSSSSISEYSVADLQVGHTRLSVCTGTLCCFNSTNELLILS